MDPGEVLGPQVAELARQVTPAQLTSPRTGSGPSCSSAASSPQSAGSTTSARRWLTGSASRSTASDSAPDSDLTRAAGWAYGRAYGGAARSAAGLAQHDRVLPAVPFVRGPRMTSLQAAWQRSQVACRHGMTHPVETHDAASRSSVHEPKAGPDSPDGGHRVLTSTKLS